MPDPPEEALEHLDYTFENMYTYSHLNYLSFNVTAGFVYTFKNGMQWTVEGSYSDLDDRTGYVFGSESGSLLVVRSGVQIDF